MEEGSLVLLLSLAAEKNQNLVIDNIQMLRGEPFARPTHFLIFLSS